LTAKLQSHHVYESEFEILQQFESETFGS